MTVEGFKYMEYIDIIDIGEWRLKKDAPEHVKKAFNEWWASLRMEVLEDGT